MIYCSSWYSIRSVVQYFVSSVVGNFIIVNFYLEYIYINIYICKYIYIYMYIYIYIRNLHPPGLRGDMIFHIPAKEDDFSQDIILPTFMDKLESVQYSAALAVTGTCRGTSREKLYAELGWESLYSRRWSRRLTLFYEILNDLTPWYTKEPIPPLQQPNYSLRDQDVLGQIRGRTEKFLSSFYRNCISEWKRLDPEIRLAPSVAVFKQNFCRKFAPVQSLSLVFMIQ